MARMLGTCRRSWCPHCHGRAGVDCPDVSKSKGAARAKEKHGWRRDVEGEIHDDPLIVVSQAEFEAAAQLALADLGLTYAELQEQARRRDFSSSQAHALWVSIGGTVNL